MRGTFTKKKYSQNQLSRIDCLGDFFSRREASLVIVLCAIFSALIFIACATTPKSEDIGRADAHNKLGYSYLNEGQLNEAFVEFQKAIQLDPKNKKSLNYLGLITARFERYDEAISYYQRAISVDPDYSDALNNLGVLYLELENWDEAIKYFKAALGNPLYGTPEKAYSSMGYAHYKKGEYVKAKKALKEALIRNPVFYPAMYTLGIVYVQLDNDRAAIKEFKRAVGIIPDYVDAHWELAKAYVRTGQKNKALKHFMVVAENEAGSERGREASAYIERLKY